MQMDASLWLVLQTGCDLGHDAWPVPEVVDLCSCEVSEAAFFTICAFDNLDVLDHGTADFERLFYACAIHDVAQGEGCIYAASPDAEEHA